MPANDFIPRSRPHRRPLEERGGDRVTGLVLCGGKSERMGRDKALIRLGERTLLQQATELLEPLVDECLLACGSTRRYEELGFPLVLDRVQDSGPLAGLAAGLEAMRGEWLIAIACDMPRLTRDSLSRLIACAKKGRVDVCLYETPGGAEPLCAVYRRTCLGPVRAALEKGERRMIGFWNDFVDTSAGRRKLAIERMPIGLDPSCDPSVNLNTLQELAREQARRAVGGFRG